MLEFSSAVQGYGKEGRFCFLGSNKISACLVLEYSRSLSGSETIAGFFALNHSLSFITISVQSLIISFINVLRPSLPLLVPFSVPDGFSEYATIFLSVPNGYTAISLCAERLLGMVCSNSAVQFKGTAKEDGFVFLTHIHVIVECDNQPLLYW